MIQLEQQLVGVVLELGLPGVDFRLLALIGRDVILLVRTICSAAVIWYYWVRKTHRGNVITKLICSVVCSSGRSLLHTRYLRHRRLRSTKPQIYREIGRTVMEDAHARTQESVK